MTEPISPAQFHAAEAHAPKWWVLADAEGNAACLATWVGRE